LCEMKVAIVQDIFSYGGRLVVLAEIIYFFNQRNITPVLVGFKVNVTKEEIKKRYDIEVNFTIDELNWGWFFKLNEFNKIWFNLIFNLHAGRYNLIINSNNTTCLSRNKNRIVYLHYPRKKRILLKEYFKNNPRSKLTTRIVVSIDYFISRILYRFDHPSRFNLIISNSDYTRSVLNDLYTLETDHQITLYPPVNISNKGVMARRNKNIISIGRINASKNQIMQLEIAKSLIGYDLHIIGFTTSNNKYYKKCLDYMNANSINNVRIHTNLVYSKLLEMMDEATFYLHTMENEPFGITTVQAISAGCIPVVHDSGGQREIVPFDELRFTTVPEAVNIIQNLEEQNSDHLIYNLKEHINKFSRDRFRDELGKIFSTL
jgi:glycosyltransferase involved in cell wall biosynthesis